MRVVLINLERARVRRERMSAAFARTGIEFEIWPAVDARALTEEDRELVDQDARRRLGLYPIPDGSLANTLSQRAAMQDLIDHGPEMMAVFEDDATFDDSLPAVLSALEECDDLFERSDPAKTQSPESVRAVFVAFNRPYAGPSPLRGLRFERLCDHARRGPSFPGADPPHGPRDRSGAVTLLGQRPQRPLRAPAGGIA